MAVKPNPCPPPYPSPFSPLHVGGAARLKKGKELTRACVFTLLMVAVLLVAGGSQNHIMYGAFDAWMAEAVGGLRLVSNATTAGWQHYDVRPNAAAVVRLGRGGQTIRTRCVPATEPHNAGEWWRSRVGVLRRTLAPTGCVGAAKLAQPRNLPACSEGRLLGCVVRCALHRCCGTRAGLA